MSQPPEDMRQLFADLLRFPASNPPIPADLATELLLKGAVITLQADASPEAVTILQESVINCPLVSIQALALDALEQLTGADNEAAHAALFELAIEMDHAAARQRIFQRGFRAADSTRQAVLELLGGRFQNYHQLDPDNRLLTDFFLVWADAGLQERLLAAAQLAGMDPWITLMSALRSPTAGTMQALQETFPTFQPQERSLAIQLLTELARTGESSAQENLCQLFMAYEDPGARAAALQNGFSPRDPVQKALFLFLTEQWQAYEVFDFNHRLLVAAYETADSAMRKRILDLSRRSGQLEWFQQLSGSNRLRWLGDLSDADWDNTIRRLTEAGRREELWRLALLASPVWSAKILAQLQSSGWQPAVTQDQAQFQRLADLAQHASANPLIIRPFHGFNIPTMDDLTAVAISPDGSILALGSISNAIHLWQIADLPAPLPVLHGAVSQTRSLSFSPDGEHLVTGVGDHTLRVYRWEDGKSIKTLEGHTGLVRSLVISPESFFLYSASFDGTIRSWRFPFGPELKTILRSKGEIFGLALSPGGDLLVAAGADRVLSVFQMPDGKPVHEMEGHTATITNLVTAPDTEYVASYSRDRTIRVWNYVSGRQIQVIEDTQDVITAVCIHPNEQVLITATLKGMIRLYSISTGKVLYELASHKRAIIGLTITAGGTRLVSSSADGSVTIWNLEVFLQIRQPVETTGPARANRIQQQLVEKSLPQSEKHWLEFTLELLRWKQRFDVQIEGEQRTISLGEFDIQL